jgi:sporulation protein YlmC with PRC-barrel domain
MDIHRILSAPALVETASWTAAAATIIAAVIVAANLGSRITGWGFVVFTFGSLAWMLNAAGTGQTSLLLTNGLLTVINLAGIWRWLGRQARYEQRGADAARRSRRRRVPTLFALDQLGGAAITDSKGEKLGTVVDAMLRCSDGGLAYLVISDRGLAGVNETLRALDPRQLRFDQDTIHATISRERFTALAPLKDDAWPTSLHDPS